MGLRNALFIGSAAAAGAFSGLIAYGVQKIETSYPLWKVRRVS